MTPPGDIEDEPWKAHEPAENSSPFQAQVGDYAVFLRKAAIEIKFEGDIYLIVPHAALLMLIRDSEAI